MNPLNMLNAIVGLPVFRWLEKRPDVFLAIAVALLVSMLLFPMPTILLDGLIAVNIAVSLIVFLVALFANNVLQVTSFPSLLLITTLFRLGLNVSVTRGILAHGEAGEMVRSFGAFVVQGKVIVGLIIFLVVTLVQFMVVAKGAERVAEVGARFTLDAMPGKQMAIDAAVRAGAISEEEGQEKRDELQRASQMFGNMDGAMKFVKGDAVAGLIITAINLVGGLALGMVYNNLPFGVAAELYSTMTIGDALVAQISSLLITLAAGILVTRVEDKDKTKNLGFSVKDEVFGNLKVLNIAAGLMMALALVPGLPAIPFVVCALGCGLWSLRRAVFSMNSALPPGMMQVEEVKQSIEKKLEEAKQQKSISDNLSPSVVPIGVDLDPVLSQALGFTHGGDADETTTLVKTYIPQLRDALYLETGVRFPGVRVRVHVRGLPEGSFMVRINDVPVLQETIPVDACLATIAPEKLSRFDVEARAIVHPLSKAILSLINPEDRSVVEAGGISVWDTAGIVGLYLASVLRDRARMFIGLQEVGELVERLEKAYPTLVKEVVPKVTNLQQLLGVLRRLVDESVSIRDLKSIVEALGEAGLRDNDPLWLTERVRAALGPQLAYPFAGMEGRMPVLLLDPIIEDTILNSISTNNQGTALTIEPEIARQVIGAIFDSLQPIVASGKKPVILTNSMIRRFVRKLIETDLPQVPVLSFEELASDLVVQPMGRAQIAA